MSDIIMPEEKTAKFIRRIRKQYKRKLPIKLTKPYIIGKDGIITLKKETHKKLKLSSDMCGRKHCEQDIFRWNIQYFWAYIRQIAVTNYVKSGYRVLDAGAGYMQVGQFLWRGRKRPIYVAMDLDRKKLRHGIKYGWGSQSPVFINEPISKDMPFKKNTFNVINCQEVIEHIPKKYIKNILKEFKRVIRKDGKLIISTPLGEGKIVRDHFHEYEWPYAELIEVITSSGFIPIEIYGVAFRKGIRELDEYFKENHRDFGKGGIIYHKMRGFLPTQIMKAVTILPVNRDTLEFIEDVFIVCKKGK